MDIRVFDQEVPLRVALIGKLDIAGVGAIETKFLAVTAGARKSVIVDLSDVDFIGSLGIGMLMGAARSLKRAGAGMVLLDPQVFVERVLVAARIPDAIPLVHGIEAARNALAG
jgi:anti-anti-sigma factor